MIRVDEASFDIERTISFIKQLAAERDNARTEAEQCRQKLEEAENNMRDAESALIDVERSLKNLPAFPVTLNEGETFSSHGDADGITIRDYFAAKAMAANIAGNLVPNATIENIADYSYVIADEMLRARGK